MARQTGSTAQVAAAFETTYGTAPATGFRLMPFTSVDLGTAQPLLDSDILGQGRDPAAPIKDVQTTDGDIMIPLDVENLGHWLKAAFGSPTTTGTTPKVHTFNSGAATLPSQSIEVQMPSIPSFQMFSGVMVNELSFTMARSGLLTGTVRVMGQGSSRAAATAAGTLATPYAIQRFGHFQGSIKRNGADLASIVSADVTYSNGLDPVATIRADGKIDGLDLGMASLRGRITARFTDLTLIDQATAGTPCELIFGHEISASAKWTLTAHAVYLPLPRTPVTGPNGIEVTFDWQAAKGTSPARMCTAVLTNTVATY
jgi:hypothetical protein